MKNYIKFLIPLTTAIIPIAIVSCKNNDNTIPVMVDTYKETGVEQGTHGMESSQSYTIEKQQIYSFTINTSKGTGDKRDGFNNGTHIHVGNQSKDHSLKLTLNNFSLSYDGHKLSKDKYWLTNNNTGITFAKTTATTLLYAKTLTGTIQISDDTSLGGLTYKFCLSEKFN